MRSRSRTWLYRALALSGGALVACSSGHEPGSPAPADEKAPASLTAGRSPTTWATTANFAGRLEAAAPMTLQIHLGLRNLDDAKAELQAISDPRSPRFRKVLSDAEFAAKYAPTDADLAAVRAHLEASGLRVTFVSASRTFLQVEGTAETAERAFSTRLGQYRVQAELRFAPIEKPVLPAAVQQRVSAVLGLSTPVRMRSRLLRASDMTPGAQPLDDVASGTCSTYFGEVADTEDPGLGAGYPSLTYAPCGYTPPQLRAAYGVEQRVARGNDGTGQKVAIVDAWTPPTLVQDARAYALSRDPSHPVGATQITLLTGPGAVQTPNKGWYGESTLDVEAVHAMAPGADIVYVGAASDNDPDLIAAVDAIVTGHLASVISNSWDGLEAQTDDFAVWEAMATQAGLKGVGLYFASGDNGDEASGADGNDGVPTVDFPASYPTITAVGGTSLAVGERDHREFEVGWETAISRLELPDGGKPHNSAPDPGLSWTPAAPGTWYYGSGGGLSAQYPEPWWQHGVVPRSLTGAGTTTTHRAVPDVAMVGDPFTGFLIGETRGRTGKYAESAIGGTSLATPLFAGVIAVAQQNAHVSFGAANPLFYLLARVGAFRDIHPRRPEAVVVPGGVASIFDFHGAGNTIATAEGYDTVTGLGVPSELFFDILR